MSFKKFYHPGRQIL